jgi:pimeloyl-ACP methyl ester carboxylesterase
VLHDIVGELHRGRYKIASADTTCSRVASIGRTTTYRSRRVAIIGHSLGGFIVSSYPGRYHDVVAMVQANAPSGLSSTNPPGNAAVLSANGPPGQGSMADKYGSIGDAWTDGRPPRPPGPGYDAQLATRRACEDFDFWRPGAVTEIATIFCDPANSVPTPSGEGASLPSQALNVNPGLIRKTGDIPVLHADADHDVIMPGKANALELSGWQENCRCRVSQFILKNTGHAFMFHRSLTTWTT